MQKLVNLEQGGYTDSQRLDVLQLLHFLSESLGLHLELLQVVSALLLLLAVGAALPVSAPLPAGHFIDHNDNSTTLTIRHAFPVFL